MENWMRDTWDDIKNQELWRIMLPGTHNSGVYSPINGPWLGNQTQTIGVQLRNGVRSLDIRVMKGTRGDYVMHHEGKYPGGEAQGLDQALEEIRSFADSHPQEVVVVRMSLGSGSNLEADDKPGVRNAFLAKLAPVLLPWSESDSYVLQDIADRGKSIVLHSEIGGYTENNLLWGSRLTDTWHETQSYPSEEKELQWLLRHVQDELSSKRTERRFFYASCFIWRLLLKGAANRVNKRFETMLPVWAADRRMRASMNIFAFDHIHQDDYRLVKLIVNLNRQYP